MGAHEAAPEGACHARCVAALRRGVTCRLCTAGLTRACPVRVLRSGESIVCTTEFRHRCPTVFWNLVWYFEKHRLPFDFLAPDVVATAFKESIPGGLRSSGALLGASASSRSLNSNSAGSGNESPRPGLVSPPAAPVRKFFTPRNGADGEASSSNGNGDAAAGDSSSDDGVADAALEVDGGSGSDAASDNGSEDET